MTTTFPPALVAAVLEAALANTPGRQICKVQSITPDALREILAEHGWPNRKAVQWRLGVVLEDVENGTATDTAYKPSTAPAAPAAPAPTIDDGAAAPAEPRAGHLPHTPTSPVEDATPAPSSTQSKPQGCEHAALITAAAKSSRQRTRSLGAKFEAIADELATRLRTERQEERSHAEARRAHQAQRDAAAAQAALAKLAAQEERLAAARATAQAKFDAASKAAGRPLTTADFVTHPCRRDDCARTFPTPQGRAAHERRAHDGFNPRAKAPAA